MRLVFWLGVVFKEEFSCDLWVVVILGSWGNECFILEGSSILG